MTVDDLLTFHGWVRKPFEVLFEHAGKVSPEEFVRQLEGFGMPTLRDQLVHIVECEDFWITKLKGDEFQDIYSKAGFGSAGQVWAAYGPVAERTREFLAGLTQEQVGAPRRITFSRGEFVDLTPIQVVLHVITHSFHHKGQAVAMCRLLGYPPPETDLDAAFP